jgi:hypothetical protein
MLMQPKDQGDAHRRQRRADVVSVAKLQAHMVRHEYRAAPAEGNVTGSRLLHCSKHRGAKAR